MDDDPTVLTAQTVEPNPEVPNNDDDTPTPNAERLELPIVPAQEEVDPPAPIVSPDPIEAPYGLNKDGTPAKKRGRKAAGTEQSSTTQFDRLDSVTPARTLPRAKVTEKGTQPVITPQQAIAVDYRGMGMLAASTWIKVGAVVFGPDWAPDMNDPVEKGQPKELADAFTGYFEAKQIKALSPEWALVLTLGAYSLTKIQKPTVASRFERVTAWLKSKLPGKR